MTNKSKDAYKILGQIYESKILNESTQYEQLFNWLGGSDTGVTGGGLYPGVSGIDAVKNMVLDTFLSEYPADGAFIAQAIDAMKPDQLLKLILVNYDGTPLQDMPPGVVEFHSSDDPEYFSAPDFTAAQSTLMRAVDYFKHEPKNDLPDWAMKRSDALQLRQQIIKRKK